jgi:hypothetical protein
MALQPLWTLTVFQFFNPYTVGRTPWTGDQPVPRSLPTHRTTQTQNKRTDIHASSVIRIHDPSVRADETVHASDRAATVIGGSGI